MLGPTIEIALANWHKYRAGKPLNEIYSLPANWGQSHEGDPEMARIQFLHEDAKVLADAFVSSRAEPEGRLVEGPHGYDDMMERAKRGEYNGPTSLRPF